MQEHKLSHPFGHLLGTSLHTFWSPAIGDSGHSCGVCISVSATYVASVVQHGILVPDRAMYVIVRIAETRIGFLSVYAPTHARARAAFWTLLVEDLQPVLPMVDSWVVEGDFNNIESTQDYQAEVPLVLTSIASSEQDAWERFLLCICAVDAWCTPSFAHRPCSLPFSWGLRRQQGRLLERLDRFYVSDWASFLGGTVCIWPGTSMSDQEEIRVIQERRSEFSGHATTARWIALDDRMNKAFFAAPRERPGGTTLHAILDDQGHLETHPDRVLDIATAYYADLFSAHPVTPEVQMARATVWSHTRRSVTDDVSRALCSRFTMQDLRDAVEALDLASCPGG